MKKIKRFKWLCKHNYSMVATHKEISANLWKCEYCGNILVDYWLVGLQDSAKLSDLELKDWKPFPENRGKRR